MLSGGLHPLPHSLCFRLRLPSPRGTALPVTLLGGVGVLWAAFPHLWSRNAAAEALGRAASSPVPAQGQAAESRTDGLLCSTRGPYWGSAAEPAGRCYTSDSLPGSQPVQLWGCGLVSPCGGRGSCDQCTGGSSPGPRHYLPPPSPITAQRWAGAYVQLVSLLKASVLAGPP